MRQLNLNLGALSDPRVELRVCAAVLFVASALPIWVAFRCGHSLMDDAYITLTYAKCLAAGRGFVFNHPPATLGTTTPLLTCVTAFLVWIIRIVTPETVAVAVTTLCWIGVSWTFLLFRKGYGLRPWQATLLGLIFIGSGRVILGHEYYLFQFLLYLSVGLHFSRRWFLTGLTVALLFLTRGEGILMLPLLICVSLGEHVVSKERGQRLTVKSCSMIAAGFAVPFGIWSAYAWTTFGRILPSTLNAKMVQGRIDVPFDTFGEALVGWMMRWWYWERSELVYIRPVFWIFILAGSVYAVRKNRKWLVVVAWTFLYTIGYTVLQVQAYWWYQLPIYFLALTLTGLGLISIIEKAVTFLPRKWPVAAAIAVTCFVIAFHAALTAYKAWIYTGDERAPTYMAMSEWLRDKTDPEEDTVAFGEVGYLGYFTDNRILDLWGLVTPEALPHLEDNDLTWVVPHYKPNFYIDVGSDLYEGFLADPWFREHYEAVASIETTPPMKNCIIYGLKLR
jgi:hypothetical protein